MYDEGYTKYNCQWILDSPLAENRLEKLNFWREKLFQRGLIGQYENGVGFGNLSLREQNPARFIISGTQTGGISPLTNQHYTTVIAYDWEQNTLTCRGPIQASSEALTHAAIYEVNPAIQGVIHVHHLPLWQSLMGKVPTTRPEIEYGTPAMAREIIRICGKQNLRKSQILVMGGHFEGIIAFGNSLDAAGDLLWQYLSGGN